MDDEKYFFLLSPLPYNKCNKEKEKLHFSMATRKIYNRLLLTVTTKKENRMRKYVEEAKGICRTKKRKENKKAVDNKIGMMMKKKRKRKFRII